MERIAAGNESRAFVDVLDGDGPTYLVGLTHPFVEGLVESLDGPPGAELRLLLSEAVAERVTSDFLLESRLASVVGDGALAVRVAPGPLDERCVLTPSTVAMLVGVDDVCGLFEASDDALLAGLRERYESTWADASTVRLRSPPRARLYESAAEALTDRFAAEFRAAIEGASVLEWDGTPTPVALALAVGARTETMLYDLGRWGEDVGFASRSSFSRTKSNLESAGVVGTAPVPQGVGRPRQRLTVGDDRLADVPAEDLVETVRSLLGES